MTELWGAIAEQVSVERAFALSRALLLLAVGFFLARLISRLLFRSVGKRLDEQRAYLLRRASYYLLLALFVAAALHPPIWWFGTVSRETFSAPVPDGAESSRKCSMTSTSPVISETD